MESDLLVLFGWVVLGFGFVGMCEVGWYLCIQG